MHAGIATIASYGYNEAIYIVAWRGMTMHAYMHGSAVKPDVRQDILPLLEFIVLYVLLECFYETVLEKPPNHFIHN